MSRRLPWLLFVLIFIIALSYWFRYAGTIAMPTNNAAPANWQELNAEQRLENLRRRRTADITASLREKGFSLGNPIFIRIMKESSELEVWLQPKNGTSFKHYKTWPVARWSGTLGPKTKEGDRQAPEGFYSVNVEQMNPLSRYHLSFNIGYPNAFDQTLQRTGNLIMVHGSNVSIGCFAMTDPIIEEIYLIAEAALKVGQPTFAVHCFPFRMTDERMNAVVETQHEFWLNLKEGWDAFEKTNVPPAWTVSNQRYQFQ